jgi:hypothetical protein
MHILTVTMYEKQIHIKHWYDTVQYYSKEKEFVNQCLIVYEETTDQKFH